ncbi:anti-sigma-factor antagonist [Streptomyces sp. OV198]|jgi:anti-anti-sigma factor|uniref:STAS domain-containing protein n=1 Tax=Streptomyces sp. OV198 TaxID=1882787 RepID=UPI000BCDBF7B|nr:STAS domain-containing protein [Streptomyces sp. OV198]SOF02183.1 anti-sigma-factor antagonist [Streptomyces sp. OV198]
MLQLQPNLEPLPELRLPGARARRFTLDQYTVVELHGEIDLYTARDIADALDAATGQPAARVIIDLRPVDFIDCSGLNLLYRAHHRTHSHGGSVRLVSDQPLIRKLLHLTELDLLLPLTATLDDALTASNAGDQ